LQGLLQQYILEWMPLNKQVGHEFWRQRSDISDWKPRTRPGGVVFFSRPLGDWPSVNAPGALRRARPSGGCTSQVPLRYRPPASNSSWEGIGKRPYTTTAVPKLAQYNLRRRPVPVSRLGRCLQFWFSPSPRCCQARIYFLNGVLAEDGGSDRSLRAHWSNAREPC
jgi:hypothetical protein